jgi:hypothetical protein
MKHRGGFSHVNRSDRRTHRAACIALMRVNATTSRASSFMWRVKSRVLAAVCLEKQSMDRALSFERFFFA